MSLTDSSTDPTRPRAETAPATHPDPGANAAGEALRVQVRWFDEQHCVITLTGELDVATAPDLVAAVEDVFAEEPERLIIDLDHVTFLDSTGLGVLVSTYQRRKADPGSFLLVCHNRACLRVMEITALNRVFTFAPTVDEALRGASMQTPTRGSHIAEGGRQGITALGRSEHPCEAQRPTVGVTWVA